VKDVAIGLNFNVVLLGIKTLVLNT
jgi:hypothetical protein